MAKGKLHIDILDNNAISVNVKLQDIGMVGKAQILQSVFVALDLTDTDEIGLICALAVLSGQNAIVIKCDKSAMEGLANDN